MKACRKIKSDCQARRTSQGVVSDVVTGRSAESRNGVPRKGHKYGAILGSPGCQERAGCILRLRGYSRVARL